MKMPNTERPISIVGIDLSKRSFHLYGVDAHGQQVLIKKLSRFRLSAFVANLPTCVVPTQTCGSAHHWARQFPSYGHECDCSPRSSSSRS